MATSVQLNVGGKVVETELSTLTRIEGSLLADIFRGQAFAPVDEFGRPVIDTRPDVFQDMLQYIRKDRAWLPSASRGKIFRSLVEAEIRKWRVDIGLASPSVLTTKAA